MTTRDFTDRFGKSNRPTGQRTAMVWPVGSQMDRGSGLRVGLVAAMLVVAGCTSGCLSTVPDPKAAAAAYATAAENGDADALYDMLTKRARATTRREDVISIVKDGRGELAEHGKAVRTAAGQIVTIAHLRYADGGEASLSLEGDRFMVRGAGAMPGGASTPEEALGGLRDALRRRSYSGLLRMLTPTLRAAVEAQLRGLIEAIDNPAALGGGSGGLGLSSTSDRTEVTLPNGHKVALRKEHGSWYIENFE